MQPGSCLKRISITNTFRRLWFEHVVWTRSFLISTAANLGDLKFVTNRLLRNPVDFYDALKKYYGDDKAKKFQDLLTEHLTIAAKIVNAAKAGDTETVNTERKKWYENANEIANFLTDINPYWSLRDWQLMLFDHLQLLEKEVANRLNGNYERDVVLFDTIENQALTMGDSMADGIFRQFSA